MSADPGDRADQDQLEEVVVTGTYIESSSTESHSPLTIVDRDMLDAIGATDVQEIVTQMTFNTSSIGKSASNWVAGDSSEGQASVNLRNLGSGATLVLLNGKRALRDNFDVSGSGYSDIQTLVPTIMLNRVEVLRDGSSALYGSDAVAGVVNFITEDRFQGWETEVEFSTDHETGIQQDTLLSTIYGRTFESGNMQVAASYLDRAGLKIGDRFERYGRSGLSSFGQPGRYVPLHLSGPPTPVTSNYWHPNGGADPAEFIGSLPDLECTQVAVNDGPMGTLGLHPDFSHICVYDYSSFFELVRGTRQAKLHLSGEFDASPTTSINAALSYAEHESSRGNSLYPDVTYQVVPASHFGLQLDAARRGFEPVDYQAMQRILGGTQDTSTVDRPVDTVSTTATDRVRLELGFESTVQFWQRPWEMFSTLIRSLGDRDQKLPTDVLTDRMLLAFAGFGGPRCDSDSDMPGSGNLGLGNCFYFNSFQTSVYDPVTGERWNETDPSPWAAEPTLSVAEAARKYQNSSTLLNWLHGSRESKGSFEQTVLDFMLTGKPLSFGARPVSVAIGAQYRQEEAEFDYDDQSNRFNLSFLKGNADWHSDVDSWALFGESLVPIHQDIELRIAGRYEQFSEGGSSTFDPKLSVRISTLPSLTLRASWGTSFKVSSLLQSGGSRTLFQNTSDPFSNAPALAYRSSLGDGNPDLQPETSDALNVGFSWFPAALPGLEVSLDRYQYRYDNLIARENHQSLVDQDNRLRCPNGVNHDIAAGPLCGVVDHDGDGVVSVFSIGEGTPDKVVRRADGYLVHTVASFFNAPSLHVAGIDLAASYVWQSAQLGEVRISSELNYGTEYAITLADGSLIDGLGQRNIANPIGKPMPKYRMRHAFTWHKNRHTLHLSSFTISDYRDEGTQSAFLGAYIGYWETIDSMSVVDLQYQIKLPQWLDAELAFGAKNLLNEDPPWVNVDGAYDYYTHNPLGRVYYMRLRMNFGPS